MTAGGFVLRRISRPLDELLSASDRVAEGDYSVRLEEKGPREVRAVARAFNSMAERLQVNDRQRRDMLADVTHELRTPLTVIRGEVEGMLDGVYPADEARLKSILEETQFFRVLWTICGRWRLPNRGVAIETRTEQCGRADLETVAAFKSAADAKGVRIEICGYRITVGGNRSRTCPRNHPQPDHKCLTLLFEWGSGARHVRWQFHLCYRHSGPGIPPDVLPHIFDRFYKSGDSGGMGLGLSIAKYLVEAHGGTIRAENVDGGGTRIVFTLVK